MIFFRKRDDPKKEELIEIFTEELAKNMQLFSKEFEKAVDLVSKTLALVTFKRWVIKDKKKKKTIDEEYYKLNIEPNDNESAFELWYKFWHNYFYYGESLLIAINEKLYVADSWEVNDTVLYSQLFKNIKITTTNGTTFAISKEFLANEVVHLKLKNKKIKGLLNDYYSGFGDLLSATQYHYLHSKLIKYILGYDGTALPGKDPETGKEVTYEKYKEKLIGSLLSEKNNITMLAKRFSLDRVGDNSSVSNKDYLDLEKHWKEIVADAFLIPRDIYCGNKTDKSSSEKDYLTYAIKSYMKLLEQKLNSRIVRKRNYLAGERIRADFNSIKIHDIIDSATNIDKLYADGFSHNDILEFMDMETIDEKWANEHRITKNYSDDVSNKSLKGGDDDEE
ncbi:MAG: phage portal protein [Bacilli bacterium]|nr:phage portal protein [Bacilli bacterium]